MSHILELLGRGVRSELGDLLDRYFWTPSGRSVEQLQAACREQPERPELHLQLGLAYLRGGQVDEAIEHLSRSCRLQADCLAARVALASAYDESGQTLRALEQLKIANQTHTGEVPILFCIGFCHERLGRPDQAADYYRDVLAAAASFLPARERLAAIDVLRGDLDEAIEQYQALRDAEPQEVFYRSALAHLSYRARRYREAVDEFETCIAMEPENWALLDDEVEALVADGQIGEAIARLESLIEQQGPFADLHLRLADLCGRVGDDDAAMKHYFLAIDLQPGYLEATVKLGTHHLLQGRWEEAAEAFHQAVELNDRLLTCYVGMGVAQAAMGERSDAMNSFDLAAAIEPNSTLLLAEMAKLQLRSAVAEEFARSFDAGEGASSSEPVPGSDELLREQAARHAEEVRRHPHHADVRYRYGVLLRAQGCVSQALEQFHLAVRISPAYAKAWIKLGIAQHEVGLVDEAIEAFHRALEIQPQYVDLHYRLGLLYTNRRNLEEAMLHMEAATGRPRNDQIRDGLALSLQNMGLMDRVAATWRSLWQIHRARAG